MEALLTDLNVQILGLKPFYYNWFKIVALALCAGGLVWTVSARNAMLLVQRFRAQAADPPQRYHHLLAWGGGVVLTTILAYLRVRQYLELQIGWDMAVESNVAWHMVHGPWFFNSFDNRTHLSQHFAPVFLVLGLVYWIWESPVTLLVIQSTALGLGAVAMYYLALKVSLHASWAPVAVLLYCVNWFLHFTTVSDFHRPVLAVPVGLWLLYCVETDRKVIATILAVFLASLEESMGLVLAGLGVVLLVTRGGWRVWGACAACLGVAYFLVIVQVIMPALSPEQEMFLWGIYAHLGSDLGGAVRNLLFHPFWALDQALFSHNQHVRVLYLFGSMAFLPLLGWRQSLPAVIPLAIMLLSGRGGLHSLGHHYSAPALPFLFYGAVHGLARVGQWLDGAGQKETRRWKVAIACLLVCIGWNIYRIPSYNLGKTDATYATVAFSLVERIPTDRSIATDIRFVSLLSSRHRVCKLGWTPTSLCDWTLEGAAPSYYGGKRFEGPDWEPEYVLIGTQSADGFPQEMERRLALASALSASDGRYELVGEKAGILLLRLKSRLL